MGQQASRHPCDRVKPLNEITQLPADAVKELRENLVGKLTLPEDQNYDAARTTWNRDVMGFPSGIATVDNTNGNHNDIRRVLSAVQKYGLRLAISAGRHSHFCMVDDALVLDLSLYKSININPIDALVRVGAGVKLGELDLACSKYGVVVPAGHNPDTGVAGLTLGGGVGYAARLHGMTVDCLVSLEVILASGEVVTASNEENADLFWALRGGGGNFGVVTEFTFRCFTMPEKVYAGARVYLNLSNIPLVGGLVTHPKEAFRKARDFWKTMPNEVGAIGVLPWNGPFVNAMVYCGDAETGRACLDAYDFGTTPINSMNAVSYHHDVQRIAEKDQQPGYYFEKGLLCDEISDELLDLFWDTSRAAGPNVKGTFVIVPLGGKIKEVAPDATAFECRNAGYWCLFLGKWEHPEHRDDVVKFVREAHVSMQKFQTGTYAPVIGKDDADADHEHDQGHGVFDNNIARLREVKTKYDPHNVFRMNRNITPVVAK